MLEVNVGGDVWTFVFLSIIFLLFLLWVGKVGWCDGTG